jgi:ribosomal protein S18 acetylase RimI-like enzyme
MTEPVHYRVDHRIPSTGIYRHLRQQAGLSIKSLEAAERGLPNSCFAVQILAGDEVVGMGRVIGDGGCFYQVVDIAVLPEHQGRGIGKMIMREISDYLEREVPDSAYVSLLADGRANELYQQFGFAPTAPASIGMSLRKRSASGAGDASPMFSTK